jgi:hypothetical protein
MNEENQLTPQQLWTYINEFYCSNLNLNYINTTGQTLYNCYKKMYNNCNDKFIKGIIICNNINVENNEQKIVENANLLLKQNICNRKFAFDFFNTSLEFLSYRGAEKKGGQTHRQILDIII